MSTRERILDAASEVIQTLGLSRATTREIAREAGFSEATLYKHFNSKEDLFVHVIMERVPNFMVLLKHLSGLAGQKSVKENLTQVASATLDFYCKMMPLGSALFSDRELLSSLQSEIKRQNNSPQGANLALADYLRKEQAQQRIRQSVDPDAASYLLLGACFQRAYWSRFMDEEISTTESEKFVTGLINSLFGGLEP